MGLTLVVLAAGKASRYGRLKQLEPVGPGGAALLDYGIHDALRAGFAKIVLVVAPGLEPMFREHVERVFDGRVNPALVSQELGFLPRGFFAPAGRRKPWGTAHAVLAAAGELSGPFAVVNADDFYGRSSYQMLRRQLEAEPPCATLVGFKLRSTLSDHGGVSRGIAQHDADGFLKRLSEVKEIALRGAVIAGVASDGAAIRLSDSETASMNMWGLTPLVLDGLRSQFIDFLEHESSDLDAEFLLSTAIGRQVSAGTTRLRVLLSAETWFGMTFAHDTPAVVARIAQLVANGEYPEHLWKGVS